VIWLLNLFYARVLGRWLPARWFGPAVPDTDSLSVASEPLHLEIVAHCWQYAHLLAYQLSSIIDHPPTRMRLTYTLFHCEEDVDTVALMRHVQARHALPGVTWNWQPLPRNELFRRAIGRNRSARASSADWLWFSDCDLIFHADCLDTLAERLHGRRSRLVYPDGEFVTELLPAEHPWLHPRLPDDLPLRIDTERFSANPIAKAKGAFQIVHGDVARAAGYCPDLAVYQRPTMHWRKTFEDTAFRNLIGSQGEPISIPGLYRIRHAAKGRYAKDSAITSLRTFARDPHRRPTRGDASRHPPR